MTSVCQAEFSHLWSYLIVEQAPYACCETSKTSPSITESLAYAYANLALFSTFFLPIVAVIVQKTSSGKTLSETIGVELTDGANAIQTGDVGDKNPVV